MSIQVKLPVILALVVATAGCSNRTGDAQQPQRGADYWTILTYEHSTDKDVLHDRSTITAQHSGKVYRAKCLFTTEMLSPPDDVKVSDCSQVAEFIGRRIPSWSNDCKGLYMGQRGNTISLHFKKACDAAYTNIHFDIKGVEPIR